MKTTNIIVGDVRTELAKLEEGSIQCCVTSPPYWGLRDYGVKGQIGTEKTIDEFIATLVDVFRGVKRVLRDDGTLWVNMGDAYTSSSKGGGGKSDKQDRNVGSRHGGGINCIPDGMGAKNLIGQPWRLAFALQADGWILRSDIIWHKPNPMPESCTDRPTKSHEYMFLLTKKPRYFYDIDAVREAPKPQFAGESVSLAPVREGVNRNDGGGSFKLDGLLGRNMRTVWKIPTRPFREAHFATFPERLVEPCLKAGTSAKGCCPECGAPWERVVEKKQVMRERPNEYIKRSGVAGTGNYINQKVAGVESKTTGWTPGCQCDESWSIIHGDPCTVLDPFSGSGTTGVVAKKLGLSYVGIELNPEYAEMSRRRIANPDAGTPVEDVPGQLELPIAWEPT